MPEIEIGINPNCSEATIRIKTSGEDKRAISALVKKLIFECNEYHRQCKSEEAEKETKDWDDEKSTTEKQEFDWEETGVYEENIFGIECIRLQGGAPYNNGDEIEEVIKRYLPNAEMEYDE